MKRRRAVVGLCMLCALVLSAVAAQGASAAGTTAYTCKEEAASTFKYKDAHCKEVSTGGNTGKFNHVAIANGTTTEVTGTNVTTGSEKSIWRLKATVGGVELELSATGLSGVGTMTNAEDPTPEMYAHGTGEATFTGVAVTKPANKNCKVFTDVSPGPPIVDKEEGVVHTERLTATTTGQGDSVLFEPDAAAGATILAKFVITGCTGTKAIEALNGTYTVTGSATCVPNGATCEFSHAKNTGLLKLNGLIPAGIEGSLTLSGRANSGEPYKPLTVTT